MGGSARAPEPTAEQKALERRQRVELQEEKAASERRLKSIAQRKIGKKSLLGTPMSAAKAPEVQTVTPGSQYKSGRIKKIMKGALIGRFL
jgi:hypothetical protein